MVQQRVAGGYHFRGPGWHLLPHLCWSPRLPWGPPVVGEWASFGPCGRPHPPKKKDLQMVGSAMVLYASAPLACRRSMVLFSRVWQSTYWEYLMVWNLMELSRCNDCRSISPRFVLMFDKVRLFKLDAASKRHCENWNTENILMSAFNNKNYCSNTLINKYLTFNPSIQQSNKDKVTVKIHNSTIIK